jgi:hypothetical protein
MVAKTVAVAAAVANASKMTWKTFHHSHTVNFKFFENAVAARMNPRHAKSRCIMDSRQHRHYCIYFTESP